MPKINYLFIIVLIAVVMSGCQTTTSSTPSEPTPAFDLFTVETTGESTAFSCTNVLLGAGGNPLIVYLQEISSTESEIKKAVKSGSSWTITRIHDPISGYYAMFHGLVAAVDNTGQVHLLFGDGGVGSQLYYYNTAAASPTTEVVATNVLRPDYNNFDLAIDGDGGLHAVYQDNATRLYTYAIRDTSGSWFLYQIPSAEGSSYAGYEVALRLDRDKKPHLVYSKSLYPLEAKDLYYAHFDGAAWHSEKIVSVEGDARWDFAVDADNRPHLAYYTLYDSAGSYTYYNIYYQYYNGTSWTSELLGKSVNISGPIVLKINSANRPCIVYNLTDPSHFARYAVKADSGSWTNALLSNSILDGTGTSFVLDSGDQPYVATTNRSAPDSIKYYQLK